MTDFQNRAGHKAGGGENLSYAERNVDRRERLRLLALEVTDLNNDKYMMRNSIGLYECKLCGSTHNREGDYLAHTQGKKHQTNLLKRSLKTNGPLLSNTNKKDTTSIIGRPGYKLTKQKDSSSNEYSLLIEVNFSEISKDIIPNFRIVSTFEQKVEERDTNFQYIVIAADPYENIGFKVPSKQIDFSEEKHKEIWDENTKIYTLLITFKI